ncbi:MAG: hypothetical protein QOF34_431, partial [Sphingomonadales bacterium]|nr:hypothetical protein [Sphingomonadales bacterium]
IADQVAVADARERIERPVSASAVWLELDEDGGGPLDDLLEQVNRDVTSGRYAAVVSASSALIDPTRTTPIARRLWPSRPAPNPFSRDCPTWRPIATPKDCAS